MTAGRGDGQSRSLRGEKPPCPKGPCLKPPEVFQLQFLGRYPQWVPSLYPSISRPQGETPPK